jgi:predicted transcriptional regulator
MRSADSKIGRLRELLHTAPEPDNKLLKHSGHTKSMKTAISMPDDVFKGAERLARRTKKSRSRLFSDAVREYVARHAPDDVSEAMDRACAELGRSSDGFVSSAARRVLERTEW